MSFFEWLGILTSGTIVANYFILDKPIMTILAFSINCAFAICFASFSFYRKYKFAMKLK